jgi:hypothetical protein
LLKNKERARKTAKVNSLQQNKRFQLPLQQSEKFCKAEQETTAQKNAVFFIKSSLTA